MLTSQNRNPAIPERCFWLPIRCTTARTFCSLRVNWRNVAVSGWQ
jgi:hypothetical protein